MIEGVSDLETAPEGSTRILIPRREDAFWLNQNRAIVTRRKLRVVLFCDHETTIELSRAAPDFFDWVSAHVECPEGLVPFALAGIRGAIAEGKCGVHWIGHGGEEGRAAATRYFEAVSPGTVIRWIAVEGAYDEVVKRIEAVGGEGEWIATIADEPWKVWRFRWACAQAKSLCREIIVAPGMECPGFWPVHDRMMGLSEACRRLRNSGARRPGLLASMLALEPESIVFAETIHSKGMSPRLEESNVVIADDSGAALAGHFDKSEDWGHVVRNTPIFMRAAGRPLPAEEHNGVKTEAKLRHAETQIDWLALATMAEKMGDNGAYLTWAARDITAASSYAELARSIIRKVIAERFPSEQREWGFNVGEITLERLRERRAAWLTGQLEEQANKHGDNSEQLVQTIVVVAMCAAEAGAPETAVLLLSKALHLRQLETNSPENYLAEPIVLPWFPFEKKNSVRAILTRFLEGPTPTLTPELAARAREILIEALRAQGRFEEAAQVESEASPRLKL